MFRDRDRRAEASRAWQIPIVPTSKPFVAIIDDDASVGRSVKRLLCSIGIDAESYVSGEEFLELVESIPSYRPACIILDVQMPGLSGLDIQQKLAGRNVPIIFITAHDEIGMREKALAAGAYAFL